MITKVAAAMAAAILVSCLSSCSRQTPLEYAMDQAGENRKEMEAVLQHYNNDPEKLSAAKFLIENMPAHVSYQGSDISKYYDIAMDLLLQKDLDHVVIRDSLLHVREKMYPNIAQNTVSDIKVMTASYLIYSIDHAFKAWKESEWAAHIDFDEFCEAILPYKVAETQPFDFWRDTLSEAFGGNLRNQLYDDEECNTTYRTVDIVRNEILSEVRRNGEYIEAGYPLLSASAMKNIAYGRCADYVNLAVATYRSLGIPSYVDATPFYGRFRAGHTWDVVVFANGGDMASEWDLASEHGKRFFPAQRFPKVFRSTYAINRDRVKYRNLSALKYPFDFCVKDVTERYTKTSDIDITLLPSASLAEDYAYIAIFNGHNAEWSIVDYGTVAGGKAHFSKMGRNILYIVQGFDGRAIFNASNPFILHQDGSIEYIECDSSQRRTLDMRRKYFESRNVAEMRQRIMGAEIQASDYPDFRNAETLFQVSEKYVDDPQPIAPSKPYKYFRYMSASGTFGSLAELAFYDSDTAKIQGQPIACSHAAQSEIEKAFDGDYLTNFETAEPDGNWVGIGLASPAKPSFVRIIPRSDDNDIRPEDTYELRYYNGQRWVSMGKKQPSTNVLSYDSVPAKALYWIKDHRRGWDERPFLIREGGKVEWR